LHRTKNAVTHTHGEATWTARRTHRIRNSLQILRGLQKGPTDRLTMKKKITLPRDKGNRKEIQKETLRKAGGDR